MLTLFTGDQAVLPEKSKKRLSQVAFHSGEMVPISGIWSPDHDHGDGARTQRTDEVWLPAHTPFPPCPGCGMPAAFVLLEEILHISEDPDFQ